jgi:mercuric ion transport protein
MRKPVAENASILAGTLSALGASACCVLPLILVSIGLGGAWVAQLRALERFYPLLVAAALAAFAFGFYRLYVRPVPCEPESACATPATRRRQRIAFWAALIFAKLLILSPFIYGALYA